MTRFSSGLLAASSRNTKWQNTFLAALRALLGASALAAAAVGCSSTTGGGPAPAPSSHSTIEQAFPSATTLGTALHATLVNASGPHFGGMDVLRAPRQAPDPAECGGIIAAGERATFRDAAVRGAAVGTFTTGPGSSRDEPVNLIVSIVEVDSPNAAQAFYARTRTRWQHCQHVTVQQPNAGSSPFLNRIDPVTESDGILYAGVAVGNAGEESTNQVLERRVFMAKSRYLIDVELAGEPPSDPGKAADTARALARTIADHIT
jgi:hypothetical protein